jgi:hypothetical protein
LKSKLSKSVRDMSLPESSSFRMALKRTADKEKFRTINSFIEAFVIPVRKFITDGDESGYGWSRRMSKGVLGVVTTIYGPTFEST